MIIDFAIKNFLSFKDEVVFSMLAAKSVKENENENDNGSNVFSTNDNTMKIVKAAAIYGANGSGKSNLILAFSFFRNMIINSYRKDDLLNDFYHKQFLFDESNSQPSGFEMNFIIESTCYRYGFEIFNEKIESEWLFKQDFGSTKESYCFKRNENAIQTNSRIFKASKQIDSLTRDNALFLTTAALSNVDTAKAIKSWFEHSINVLSGIGKDNTISYTAKQYANNKDMHDRIIDFIRIADFGIQDITVEESFVEKTSDIKNPIIRMLVENDEDESKSPDIKVKQIKINSLHNKYKNGIPSGTSEISLGNESLGTRKTFALIGPWLDTLMNGKTLIIDEFGASIHTKLALELVRVFQSKLNNGAQLIIATHDTNLLRKDLLRRDQIWFTEKDEFGVSDLYSLVEYKINQATSVRNDASFSKDYLVGKYGAIPHFGNIEQFIRDYGQE